MNNSEKMSEVYNPVYNKVSQVKYCASGMLKEEVKNVELAIVIGHNGHNLVSSTDWRLTTAGGRHRIMMFAMHPQYQSFVECVSGVRYCVDDAERFCVQPDPFQQEKFSKVIMPDGSNYVFMPGESLKITVPLNSKFLATDCLVECEETEDCRIYTIYTDADTEYGMIDENGMVSRV